MQECKRETCFVPDTGCDLGHTDLSQCPVWSCQAEATSAEPEQTNEVLLPWSGSALGLADLGFVSGRARPFIVGVAGSQNAGKTTLLGAWYLLLGRGAVQVSNHQFAGSYSISGWEAVSGSLRWDPGQPPSFPPHTTSRSGRAPGLLHLSFWDAGETRSRDYRFTDAPGEWFQKWAINRDSAEGVGARWIADRADIFLIVADREALSGENMGSARNALRLLARRLADERRGRPVALVWTKSDVAVSPEMERAVRDAVMGAMPDAAEFSVSVVSSDTKGCGNGVGLIELLRWILEVRRARLALPPPSGGRDDPLFMYGARSS
jgi:hypothetical protein